MKANNNVLRKSGKYPWGMTHAEVLEKFKQLFPDWTVTGWWKKGENRIRIRTSHCIDDLTFMYCSPAEWELQTLSKYEKDLAAGKKMA